MSIVNISVEAEEVVRLANELDEVQREQLLVSAKMGALVNHQILLSRKAASIEKALMAMFKGVKNGPTYDRGVVR